MISYARTMMQYKKIIYGKKSVIILIKPSAANAGDLRWNIKRILTKKILYGDVILLICPKT